MLLYVIRHGQTDWNAEGRLQGQTDIPLNEIGRLQATGNGEKLKDLIGTAEGYRFVSSPLSRTRETMERARTAMGLDPAVYDTDARLVELSFGDWEGHTLKEVKQFAADKLKERSRGKWSFIPPGDRAESYEILCWRIGSFLQSLDRPTVCVCHGGVIRSIFRLVGHMPEDEAASIAIPQDRILEVRQDIGQVGWL